MQVHCSAVSVLLQFGTVYCLQCSAVGGWVESVQLNAFTKLTELFVQN